MINSETVTDVTGRDLVKEMLGLETDMVLAEGVKRNMNLDRDLVYRLQERNVNVMKKMDFLEEFSKSGDPNDHLNGLLAAATKLSPADEAVVTKINNAIKRPIKTMTDFLEKHGSLFPHVKAAPLRLLIETAGKILAKIPPQES
jgi:hypothetical protein